MTAVELYRGKVPIIRQRDLDSYEGYLYRTEGARLCWLATQVPAGREIVEIGSFKGKSACYLARGVQIMRPGLRPMVHCVDLWDIGGQGEYVHLGFDEPETYDTFKRQVSQAGAKPDVAPWKADSVTAGRNWHGLPIGLLFIDGDHRYEPVWADIEAWTPHLAPGAWVAFHDYYDKFPGVIRAVDEWVAQTPHVEYTRVKRLVAVKLP